jgi:ankyrin repeat protein
MNISVRILGCVLLITRLCDAIVHTAVDDAKLKIFEACKTGNLPVVRDCWRGRLDSLDGNQNTIMHVAVENKQAHVVHFLFQVDGGKDLLRKIDKNGRTPFHIAAALNDKKKLDEIRKITELLIGGSESRDWDMPDKDGQTPLHRLAACGCSEMFEKILSCHLRRSFYMDKADSDGRSMLLLAATNGNLEILKLLLVQTDVERYLCDKQKQSALHLASANGHSDVVRYLHETGWGNRTVNENMPDSGGNTPLHLATANNHSGVSDVLLKEFRADSKVTNLRGETPLFVAAERGYLEMAQLLAGASNVNLRSIEDWGPLEIAVARGHLDIVMHLVRCGAEVNPIGRKSATPLQIAVLRGSVFISDNYESLPHVGLADMENISKRACIVRLLLQNKANINAVDASQRTALQLATTEGYDEVVRLLFEASLKQRAASSCLPKSYYDDVAPDTDTKDKISEEMKRLEWECITERKLREISQFSRVYGLENIADELRDFSSQLMHLRGNQAHASSISEEIRSLLTRLRRLLEKEKSIVVSHTDELIRQLCDLLIALQNEELDGVKISYGAIDLAGRLIPKLIASAVCGVDLSRIVEERREHDWGEKRVMYAQVDNLVQKLTSENRSRLSEIFVEIEQLMSQMAQSRIDEKTISDQIQAMVTRPFALLAESDSIGISSAQLGQFISLVMSSRDGRIDKAQISILMAQLIYQILNNNGRGEISPEIELRLRNFLDQVNKSADLVAGFINTILKKTYLENSYQIAEFLLSSGADVKAKTPLRLTVDTWSYFKDGQSLTPLHIASWYGNIQLVDLLLRNIVTTKKEKDAIAIVNAVDEKNRTALHLASMAFWSNFFKTGK